MNGNAFHRATMQIPFEKSNSDKSSTTISLSLNSTFFPFDFDDASKYKLSIGKSLCSNI